MNDEPVFEAMLSPHRSLGRSGLIVVVTLTASTVFFQLIFFAAAGAWPIAGFLGLDLVLLYGAFWLNYRAARAREFVTVSRTALSVRKVTPSGRQTEFNCNPFWARFTVRRHEEIGITNMRVTSRGQGTDLGSFLNPVDKESFASAFSGALATVKRG